MSRVKGIGAGEWLSSPARSSSEEAGSPGLAVKECAEVPDFSLENSLENCKSRLRPPGEAQGAFRVFGGSAARSPGGVRPRDFAWRRMLGETRPACCVPGEDSRRAGYQASVTRVCLRTNASLLKSVKGASGVS